MHGEVFVWKCIGPESTAILDKDVLGRSSYRVAVCKGMVADDHAKRTMLDAQRL